MSRSDEFGRCRLAVYGTLRRGGSNYRVIEGIAGEWTRGFVHGIWKSIMDFRSLSRMPEGMRFRSMC